MKARGRKISMLYVTTLDEAAAAAAAGIDMLSIEGRFFSPAMGEAVGRLLRPGRPALRPFRGPGDRRGLSLAPRSSPWAIGGDCFYCAASLKIQKVLCDNAVPVVAHVGLIPSQKHMDRRLQGRGQGRRLGARAVWDHVKRLEAIGCFGAELEVVPDRGGRPDHAQHAE